MLQKKQILFYMMVFAITLFINNRNVYATANPVTLVAPVNGFSSTDGKWPALQWSAGAGMSTVNGYRIQVSKVANFATLVVDECTRETSYLPADAWWAQTQMGTFYWRINYVSQHWSTQAGCKRQSVNNGWWSEIRSYTNPVGEKRPAAVNPNDGYTTSDGLWPTLEWSPASGDFGGFGYRIQVSKAANFSTLVVDECTTGTSYRPTSDEWARGQTGTHYWRVNYVTKAWSGNQTTCKSQYVAPSLWSGTRSFVNVTPQNRVVAVAPSNGLTSTGGIWPTLSWESGSNMSYYFPYGYYVEISRNSSFTDRVVYECTTSTSYKPFSDSWMQSIRGRLYWRVSYVPRLWNGNQSTCKSQNFASNLSSETRYFDNP